MDDTLSTFCPLLWDGLYIEPSGSVKPCCISNIDLGNINNERICNIINNKQHIELKKQSLENKPVTGCDYCYKVEKINIDSSLRRHSIARYLTYNSKSFYNSVLNYSPYNVDLRWANTCDLACVMCGPYYSSKWNKELNFITRNKLSTDNINEVKHLINRNVNEVYLAGGEPLLIKENEEFLKHLLKINPNVILRINSNINNINTKIYNLIKKFSNVYWTVSVDGTENVFEYVRWPAKWNKFQQNLKILQTDFSNIDFNVTMHILNYIDIIENLLDALSDNIKIMPTHGAEWLSLNNMTDNMYNDYKSKHKMFDTVTPTNNLELVHKRLNELDTKRNTDWKLTFEHL